MVRVLVAEKNEVLRTGIRSVLDGAPGVQIVAEVTTVGQLLSCLGIIPCDILLIEAGFLQRASMHTSDTHLSDTSRPRTIVFSYVNNPAQGLVALQDDIGGYLTSRCSPAELCEAIARVAAGKRYIDHAFVEELASFLLVSPDALPRLLLSPREMRIYKMLMLGLSLPDIAAQLGISLHAARFNRTRIIDRMQLDGIADLVHYASGAPCVHQRVPAMSG